VSEGAERWYQKLAPLIRLYITPSEIDESALGLMSIACGLSSKAKRKLRHEGMTVELYRNPAAQIWRDNPQLFLAFSTRFGLTPVERIRPGTVKPKPEKGHSTLEGEWNPSYELP
jgi:hypothetical protein